MPRSNPDRVRSSVQSKYQNSLYFYCSKEIAKYMRSKTTSHEVALFHDYYYWDYVEEFMKRFYRQNEAKERIILLEGKNSANSDYFRSSRLYEEELPRLMPCRSITNKRTRRRVKNQRKLDEYCQASAPGQIKDSQFVIDIDSKELDDVIH